MNNFTFRIGETDVGKPVKMDLATLIDTRLLDVANSGGGKSYLLRVIIERTAQRVQWIIIDPEGEYATLREKFDFLLIGPDGELPVDERSAGLLARKLMETRVSAIIDLYGLLELRAPWTAKFLDALLTLPKTLWTPLMVAIDEAHKFCPERGDVESKRAVITLADSGRKQNRGCAICSQRLSKLAADARAELNNNFIGRIVQDLDRERAADILGISKRDSLVLRDLRPGEFFAFGPAFLFNGVQRVKVDTAETKHPKAGERHLLDVPKASDALQHVVSQMGDLPQQAQAETDALKAAQREVVELRRQLAARPVEVLPQVEIKVVEKPVLNGELPRLEAAIEKMNLFSVLMLEHGNQLASIGDGIRSAGSEVARAINAFQSLPVRAMVPVRTVSGPTASTLKPALSADNHTPVEELSAPQERILDALAQFEVLGLTMPHKSNVAVFSDQSPSSSGYQNNLGRLRTMGLIEYKGSGRVALTNAGRSVAHPAEMIRTLEDLHAAWYSRLPRPKAKLLQCLVQAYPEPLGKNELAECAGASPTSSGYQNNLGALRSLGLLDYPRSGYIVATTLLFPDGLK